WSSDVCSSDLTFPLIDVDPFHSLLYSVPNNAAISCDSFRRSLRRSLRSFAPLYNIFSCSVSGYIFGTTAGFPSSPNATKVKKAVAHTDLSAVNNPSLITFTKTSIDVLCTYVTNPSIDIESPTFTGCKKSTESVDAVTTDCLA